MPKLFVIACVIFEDEKEDLGDGRFAVGFYRNFGLTASSREEVMELLRSEMPDGILEIEEINEVDYDQLDDTIRKHSLDPDSNKIWYRSGRAFFENIDVESDGLYWHMNRKGAP